MSAQQLQVFDVVGAAAALRDYVVDGEIAEGEFAAAAVAASFLLAEQDMLVLAVGHWRVDVGAPGDVGAGGDQAVVELVMNSRRAASPRGRATSTAG